MAKRKIHWYWGCGWGRAYSHDISASQFLSDSSKNPDWFCVTCATKARLALAKESAPKPADVVWPKPRPIVEADQNTRYLCWYPSMNEWVPSEPNHPLYNNSALHWASHFLPLPPSPEVK